MGPADGTAAADTAPDSPNPQSPPITGTPTFGRLQELYGLPNAANLDEYRE
ncbi:hypothetical protein [Saccharopolyspora phatthalungensis]|uniref:Uncharacterized protein n=1 Tax=Saccharopolyspora phatthalungensis TaxID=664693 RepID=A0A840PX36_9PSEU|nr:hypothetical protein [Saccharopolyspora phatthalungensis]MBB5152876.1 hypothetical protein [Saccharopolyspora phatthalungensis]